MPIDLSKHSKIWINANGIIPDKIINRLLAQQSARPDDKITLFVNEACFTGSATKIDQLKSAGIDLINIETNLNTAGDHPYLIKMVSCILERAKETKEVRDYVFASDIIRMMRFVQEKGMYSDTDVLFFPSDKKEIENTSYLFGAHATEFSGADTNVIAVEESLMNDFQKGIVEELNYYAHNEAPNAPQSLESMNKDNVVHLMKIPGIMYYAENIFKDESKHTINNFPETKGKVLYKLEDHSFTSEEKRQKLYQGEANLDPILIEFKKQLENMPSERSRPARRQ